MDLITLDFETYYSQDYSLSKLTTEEYVRDPRFQAILCSVKRNDRETLVLRGLDEIELGLEALRSRIEASAMLCHHAHFDGFILSERYNIRPKVWFDTLSMARAVVPQSTSKSLASLLKFFGIGEKGTAVLDAKGKRWEDFTAAQLEEYIAYNINDTDSTYELFTNHLLPGFPVAELKLIDKVVRMFTEPVLMLDSAHLDKYVTDIQIHKAELILQCGVSKDELMSNDKFAQALRNVGVVPPMKDSPTAKNPDGTPKRTYAFAKTDDAMQQLLEHEDEQVQALVAARLGNKSTINETRALRMSGMGRRGTAPIYLNYSGAGNTHRLSGGDKMNWQNLSKTRKPKAGQEGRLVMTPEGVAVFEGLREEIDEETGDKRVIAVTDLCEVNLSEKDVRCHMFGLRDSVYAPEGHVAVVVDSANIEARVLDTLVGQEDAVQMYRAKGDPYCALASMIYGREITKADEMERQLGKVAKLGLGFGMGINKFHDTAHNWGVPIDISLAVKAVETYRGTVYKVPEFWKRIENCFPYMGGDRPVRIDDKGLLVTSKQGILLPNGLHIRYPGLHRGTSGWSYHGSMTRLVDGKKEPIPMNLYGGKATENVVQALARIIVAEQLLTISKRYKVAHFVHDELVLCVRREEAKEALAYALEVMRTSPSWWPEVPLDAAGDFATIYGMA